MKKVFYFLTAILICSSIAFTLKKAPSERKVLKKLSKSFGHIPSGNLNIDDQELYVSAFYMSETVVTNGEYQAFLNELIEKGETEKYEIAKVENEGWNNITNGKISAYAKEYHQHPAYANYPVVNVSKEGAELYCEWLTEKTNKILSEDKQLKFRLPSKAEWIRAAEGTDAKKPYTWGGPFLRNSRGVILANYSRISDASTSRNEDGELVNEKTSGKVDKSFEHFDVTAPVNSYYPNEFGLYNMNGNVSEILAESDEVIGGSWFDGGRDIQNRSTKKYDGASAMVGFRICVTSIQ